MRGLCVCMHMHDEGTMCPECGCTVFFEWDNPEGSERIENIWESRLMSLTKYTDMRYFWYPVATRNEVLPQELIALRDALIKEFPLHE